jgi:hypothetical protein
MKIIFPIYHFFPESEKNFLENNKSSFQKCPLGKKGNPYDIFHARKGHFAPGKRALGKTWRGLPPPPLGTYTQNIHYLSTRSYALEEKNRSKHCKCKQALELMPC